MTANSALVINVDITKEGNFYYASSADLAGLHVCGESPDQACDLAMEAAVILLKCNRGMNVRILPATTDINEFPHLAHHCNQFVALAA